MASSESEGTSRVMWVIVVALLATFAGLAWALRAPGITLTNDDALYLYLSESIRQLTYRELYMVGQPVHSLYPPGYPTLLALGSFVLGDNPARLLMLGIVAAIAGLVVLWTAVRPAWGPIVAAGTLALAAINPGLIHVSGVLLSEAPFFAFTMIAVWAAARRDDRRMAVIAAVAAIAAALTRTAGVTVVLAVLITWLLDRRWRPALALVIGAALTVAPWLIWSITAPDQDPERSYAADAVAAFSDYDPRRVPPDSSWARPHALPAAWEVPAALVRRVGTNAALYGSEELPWALPAMTIPGTTIDNWLWLGAILVFGIPGLWQLWRRWRPAAVLLGCYGALLLAWPWAFSRFLIPVVPIIILALLVGAVAVGRRLGKRGVIVPLLFGTLIGAAAIAQNVQRLREVGACDRGQATQSPACFGDDARSWFAAAQYAGSVLAPQDRVAVRGKEAAFAYFSDRKVVRIVRRGPVRSGQLLDNLASRGAGYILLAHLGALDREFARAIDGACDRLVHVQSFPPQTYLFRLSDAAAPDQRGDGCAAVREYLASSRLPGWKSLW